MKKNTLIAILVLLIVGVFGAILVGNFSSDSNNDVLSSESNGIVATVYKSPSCGCCGVYSSYMKKQGYAVTTKNVEDMAMVKKDFSIPYELESCHTMEIGGYVVEGHIPDLAVQKLLAEKPDIKGIGMPGMPSGSPGMPGPKNEDFVIYEITHDGEKGEVFMTI